MKREDMRAVLDDAPDCAILDYRYGRCSVEPCRDGGAGRSRGRGIDDERAVVGSPDLPLTFDACALWNRPPRKYSSCFFSCFSIGGADFKRDTAAPPLDCFQLIDPAEPLTDR